MIQNLLRAGRAGAAKLELILPSTNKASQAQHVFAPKDTDFPDIQAVEDVVPRADGRWLENTGDIEFHELRAVDSSISAPSVSSSSSWGTSFHFGSPSVPSFYSHPELRVGSSNLAAITRNLANGSRPSNYGSANEVSQTSPSFPAFAQLGPTPLIAGTMWMPVLWPVFRSDVAGLNAATPSNPVAETTWSSMNQQADAASNLTQIDESSRPKKPPSQARRRQRGAKKTSAAEAQTEELSARQESHEPRISTPALSRECSETASSASSPDTSDSIQTSTRSSISPSSETRIESWADAVDDEDECCQHDPEVDPMLLDLDGSDDSKKRDAIEWVIGSVYPLAVTRRGCRIVQRALEVAPSADQQRIAEKLRGHVEDMLKSPNANHVLQKCIEVMPPEKMQFMVEELQGKGAFAARHRFGCRILQRLFEHCIPAQTEELVNEILIEAPKLFRHQYGNFVIQHILQHGSPDQLHEIASMLRTDVIRLAKHRIASHVVSCAMVHCSPEDVQSLTEVVLGEAGQLADLSRRQYGSFVVREVHRAARLHNTANL
jgi:hypothetical protein